MSWQNNWSAMPPPAMNPQYPPPLPTTHTMPPAVPLPGYGAVNTDQYNQWQWQQYQQQYAQWYAMYGEKYAQQTGNALPPVAAPMPQSVPNVLANPYVAAPLPVGPAFGSMSMVAPPPPSEPHPDELRMGRSNAPNVYFVPRPIPCINIFLTFSTRHSYRETTASGREKSRGDRLR